MTFFFIARVDRYLPAHIIIIPQRELGGQWACSSLLLFYFLIISLALLQFINSKPASSYAYPPQSPKACAGTLRGSRARSGRVRIRSGGRRLRRWGRVPSVWFESQFWVFCCTVWEWKDNIPLRRCGQRMNGDRRRRGWKRSFAWEWKTC